MLKMDQKINILSLIGLGKSIRQIALELKISRNTIRKYLKLNKSNPETAIVVHNMNKESVCEPFKSIILKWLENEPKLSSLRVWEKLSSEHGYEHGYDSVRRYVRKLR